MSATLCSLFGRRRHHQPWAARHGLRLAFGTLLMLAIALIDVRLLFRHAYTIYGICLRCSSRWRSWAA
ncbi:MAG: hypothetical protein R3C97_06665 [Geminicoccaceae bacterium]